MLPDTRSSAGKAWTGNGETHDDRGPKQRDEGDTRPVPIPSELVKILRAHIEEFGAADDGRIFTNERGGLCVSSTYYLVWTEARTYSVRPDRMKSKLAVRPYDRRHGEVSLGLNGTADPTDVAERAGHSVETLLRVYAKCIDGWRDANNKLVAERLNEAVTPAEKSERPAKDKKEEQGQWTRLTPLTYTNTTARGPHEPAGCFAPVSRTPTNGGSERPTAAYRSSSQTVMAAGQRPFHLIKLGASGAIRTASARDRGGSELVISATVPVARRRSR